MAGFSYPMRLVRGVPVITAPTVLGAANAGLLRAALALPAMLGYATVVLDLTGTRSCDPAGLDVLVRAHGSDVAEGGELRLVAGAGPVMAAIAAAGLRPGFRTFGSVAAAVTELPAMAIEPRFLLASRRAG